MSKILNELKDRLKNLEANIASEPPHTLYFIDVMQTIGELKTRIANLEFAARNPLVVMVS